MLTITIKDLKMNLGNSNLLVGKSSIRFKPSAQKRETGRLMADALYYQY